MSIKWLSLTFVFGLTAVAPVFGETIYVSDQLIISLRAGQSEGSRLIRTLKTDTPLEVLEKGKEYFLVKTPEGEQGYVLSQYVTRKTPKPHIIEQLEKKVLQLEKMVDNLRAKENDLEQRLTETKGRENDLQKQLEEAQRNIQGLHQDLESTGKEYAALRDSAANVVEVVSERDRWQGKMNIFPIASGQ